MSAPTLSRPVPEREATPQLKRARHELWRVAPVAVLAGAMLLAAAVLLYAGRGLSFYYDEWNFVLHRGGWGAGVFLEPHNEHLSLIPVAVYKLLFATAGLDDYWVYRAVLVALHLVCAGLVFVLARRRVGDWGAVLATVPVLFLGAAWEDLVWPFQIGFLGSVAAGLGALVALERSTRRGDVVAAVLLGTSLACSSLGVPFIAGAAAELAWRRGTWRRLLIVAAPVALYGLWYLEYGASALQRGNLLPGLDWALDAAAAAAGGLIGQGLDWGRPLFALVAAGTIWALARPRPVSARVVALLVVVLSFWVLTGWARSNLSAPESSRYTYLGGVILILLACELAQGVVLPRRMLAVGGVVVAVVALLGLPSLRDGVRGLRGLSNVVQAELGAIELAAGRMEPGYEADPGRAPQVTTGAYLRAVRDHGSSPADSPEELARVGGEARREADRVLQQVNRIGLAPTARGPAASAPPAVDGSGLGTVVPEGGCVALRTTRARAGLDLTVPPNGLRIEADAGSGVEVRLRRFYEGFEAPMVGVVPAGAGRTLRIPADRSSVAWHVRLTTNGPLTACALL